MLHCQQFFLSSKTWISSYISIAHLTFPKYASFDNQMMSNIFTIKTIHVSFITLYQSNMSIVIHYPMYNSYFKYWKSGSQQKCTIPGKRGDHIQYCVHQQLPTRNCTWRCTLQCLYRIARWNDIW